jgi:L-fuculose-phosphate aldolase
MEEAAARQAMVGAGVRLRAAGLIVATEGNLSLRLDLGRLLITPGGRRKDELGPADLVVVGIAPGGTERGGAEASSDLAIHRRIYSARDDVWAIAHAHPPASLALTLAGEPPDPAVLPETASLLPSLPFVPYAAPGSPELAESVASSLSAAAAGEQLPEAVLLERHGAIGVGRTIDEAVDRLEFVELLCRVWRDARALGWLPAR